MAPVQPILLAVHTLPHQGRRLLESKWLLFLDAIRKQLRQHASEEEQSSEDLLLFQFAHPYTAVAALLKILAAAKKEFGWAEESLGSLPLQMVLHFDKKDEYSATLRDLSATLWDFLRQETIYLTRPLKVKWPQFMEEKELPAYTLEREGMGLFRLSFTDKAKKKVTLFPYRELAVLGKKKECFYCGMTNHLPSACPSKLLTMDMQGLRDAGYLAFNELSEIFKEAFANQEKITSALAGQVTPAQIRKTPALLVFVAFFDLYRLYQLRFLHHTTFSTYGKWDLIWKRDRINIDSRNLHIALDCLRVGQYAQAEKLFHDENMKRDGRHFAASIGLAFTSLEQGRESDFQNYLQRAANLATEEKEKIYIQLLISRQALLAGDKWKAEQALNAAFSVKMDCEEARYAKARAMVRNGIGEQAFNELRTLAQADKEYFLTVLMDPVLLPLHGMIEEMLAAQLHIVHQEALDHLNRARAGCDQLHYWLDEKDPQFQETLQTLKSMESQFERKSYFDILDVYQYAQSIYYTCHQVRDAKIEELDKQLETEEALWRAHKRFWDTFPYQMFFKEFGDSLQGVQTQMDRIRALADQRKGEAFRTALNELETLKPTIAALKKTVQRMVWTKLFIDGLRIFTKNLLITEAVVIVLGLVAFAAISTLVGPETDSNLLKVLQDPWFQKQSTFAATVIFAPVIALMATIWKVKDS